MRVVYVGNFSTERQTEVHFARDAETIPGVVVDRVQEPPRRTTDVEYRQWFHGLINRCDSADLLLYTKTHGLPEQALDVFRYVELAGCQTASFHLDLFVGLDRQDEIDTDPFWRTGTVFTADGDPATAEYMRKHDVTHRWLAPAIVSDECVNGTLVDGVPDLVFVGSRHYHGQWGWRETLISRLERTYGPRFGFYGAGRPMWGHQLNSLYTSTRVVVGDSLCPGRKRNYWSDRYYETIGRGGFLIAPDVPGIRAHFEHGKHLVLVPPRNWPRMFDAIEDYIDQPMQARAIARAGQAHVLAHHTYRHRAEQMFKELALT